MNTLKSISIVLPCHNEEEALPFCLEKIVNIVEENNLDAEILVINNNSTDNSLSIAQKYQQEIPYIKVLNEHEIGYGNAYLKGLSQCTKENIFMADADGSYDFSEIPNFLRELNNGADMVIGNRFSHKISKNAMPHLHKYIGNPLLSSITRNLFGIKIKDIHCGARAIKKKAYEKLNLQTTGMEFASEMIILANKKKLNIVEIPIKYYPRIGDSKLKTFSDGWRHLRFILLNSPITIFLIPGLLLLTIGITSTILLYFFQIELGNIRLQFHPMFITSMMIIIGYQLIFFSIFSKIYAITHLGDEDKIFEKLFKYITIERAGIIGIILSIIGLIISGYIVINWIQSDFGSINQIKNFLVSMVLIALGIQTISSAFMLSILSVKKI